MDVMKIEQTCYSFPVRELAIKAGLTPQPDEWVTVEVDEDTVDVIIRRRLEV